MKVSLLSGRLLLGALALLCLASIGVSAQNGCADCHFANPGSAPAGHLSAWDQSAHGRNQIGCQACHGGNPDSLERIVAHRGIVNSRNASSPVNARNLPITCGKCHTGPFVEFQKSRHYLPLRAGDRAQPTCITCHDEVGANRPSPKELEKRCDACHGAGKRVALPELAADARIALQDIRDARAFLKEAQRFIARISDRSRRAEFEEAAQQAEVPLTQATFAVHQFTFDMLRERLATARERISQLYDRLVNRP